MAEPERQPAVLVRRDGAVMIATLNRPEKSNTLDPDTIKELSDLVARAEASSDIAVLILTGAGRSFCAGLDLNLLVRWTPEENTAYLTSAIGLFQRIWKMPQPVIAAINGAAIAGGFDLAAFCDIRLAARTAKLGQAEINVGLTQIIHPLYKTVGLAQAKELAMTGDAISAEEAFRIGLINHVYEPEILMEKAIQLGQALAAKPRAALFETKRLTRELIDLDTDTALQQILASLKERLASDEHKAAASAVLVRVKRSK